MKNVKTSIAATILALFLLALSCQNEMSDKPADADGWLKGDEAAKFETMAAQLRGFDVAMVETGYRYQELFWAGQDENWDYAKYQLEKINLAIKSGLERRPKRAKSAEHFLTEVLPEMQKTVEARDTALFHRNFQLLTANCNSCHALEKVPFFTVQAPMERQSPIRK